MNRAPEKKAKFSFSKMGILHFLSLVLKLPDLSSEDKVQKPLLIP